jgi:octaprenyl-diphosphate synthase
MITPSEDPAPAWKQIIGSAEWFLQEVNRRLEEQILAFDPDIAAYAKYALTGQGKQLRPALVALSAGATGATGDDQVQVAVIIEMVHLATLVHDDVMDEAEIRRGQPTLAANWGSEIAVLLGDCLFAQALKLAAGFPTPEICRAVSSATNTVCAGEILQTQRRHQLHLSQADYFKMLQMKTGELFALSCDLGAYLSGAPREQRTGLRRYGMAMGTAYQVFDDCLDLFGSESAAGKSLGTDLAKGKLTLPVLVLLERADKPAQTVIRSLLTNWQAGHFSELRKYLETHQVFAECRKVVQEYLNAARHTLKPLPPSESREGLNRLVEFLGRQMAWLGQSQAP